MTKSMTEEVGPAKTAGSKPKSKKKARVAPRRAPVASAQAKSTKKATQQRKRPRATREPRWPHPRSRAKVARRLKSWTC